MSNDFSATQVLILLYKRKWWIFSVALVVAVGSYLYARTLPEYYKSTINCVPPRIDNSMFGGGAGGVGSALKDFGLTKLGGKQGDGFEFIIVLYTRSLRDSMIRRFNLVEEYGLSNRPLDEVRAALEENIEINLHFEGNYEITVWSKDRNKSVKMCEAFVQMANEVANKVHRDEASKSTEYLLARIGQIDSALNALTDSLSRYSRDYLMFAPKEQATASATALAESMAETMKQETLLGLLERNYGADDPQVKAQRNLVADLHSQLDRMKNEPGFAGNFKLTDAAGIGAQYVRVTSDFEAHAKLKAFLLPTLEQAQLDMNKTTPSLIVVDPPMPAENKDRPKRALIAAGSGVGAFVTMVLFFLGIQTYRRFKEVLAKEA